MKLLSLGARGFALLVVAALLGLLVYHFAATSNVSAANLTMTVIWPRRSSTVLSTRTLRGRPTVLNFWASWCDPCRREASLLRDAATRARGRVTFVGVDVHDATSDARTFLGRHGIGYTVVRGNDAAISAYDIAGLPETIYLDSKGHVVARTVGELTARGLTTNLARLGTSD